MLYIGGRKALQIDIIYNYANRIISLTLMHRNVHFSLKEDFPDLETLPDFEITKDVINRVLDLAGYKLLNAYAVTTERYHHVFTVLDSTTQNNPVSMICCGHEVFQIQMITNFETKQLGLVYLARDPKDPANLPLVPLARDEFPEMSTTTDFETLAIAIKKLLQYAKFSLIHSSSRGHTCLNDYFIFNFTSTR